jgi:hypothetical protein
MCVLTRHEQTTPDERVTLWVRLVLKEEAELQYSATKGVSLQMKVDDFKADWAAEELPGVRPSRLVLRLVSCAGDEPTLAEERDAKVLRPRHALAAEGVSDGCWLVVSVVAPPSLPGARVSCARALHTW